MKCLAFIFGLLCVSLAGFAQSPLFRANVDVQHYHFTLTVNDTNDSISGVALITVKFLKPVDKMIFDLSSIRKDGRGMKVDEVKVNTTQASFTHADNKLDIKLKSAAAAEQEISFVIRYRGIPADGFIIAKNRYGNRTMFSDNWPNRAHHWIPCVDHPSDKATVEFEIKAPNHYQVVSNGMKVEETNLPEGYKRTQWKEEAPLPTKVMAVGIADFAVGFAGYAEDVPVYSWVYPEDRAKGFYDYNEALEVLSWFIKNVGPYPYKKLANVQSKTIFGGLENASAIFYAESSVDGERKVGDLLAHEIAHQWFGNSVTETNWPHLWLSEGFATYMCNLYLESEYGKDTLMSKLRKDREEVVALNKTRKTPVIDTTVNDYMELLNANSYQKGSWVLHMLRRKLGDNMFWKGIAAYYQAFEGKNASSDDFRIVMEQVSKQDLKLFFKQWLRTEGHPKLEVYWKYDPVKTAVDITVIQQGRTFDFPLEIEIDKKIHTFQIKDAASNFSVPAKNPVKEFNLDPKVNLLFEGQVKK